MRAIVLVVLLGCARPAPSLAPANVAPATEEPIEEDIVVDHDEERLRARGRELYEEAQRRAEHEELRAKIRDGRITCVPTGNRIHGPSAVCTETKP